MKENRKAVQYLPSWEIRHSIWLKNLMLELQDRGFSRDKMFDGVEKLHMDAGHPVPDAKTISNWIKKVNLPGGDKLGYLCNVSPSSKRWLKTDFDDEPLHYFLNALDYYICSIKPDIKPTLFNKDEQGNFSKLCLTKIADYWNISSVNEDHGRSLRKKVQDVSLSKLKTHGYSAMPFYLSCIAVNEDVSESECFDWYLDLLCSTLIISGNLHRQNIDFEMYYQYEDPDMTEYMGTCPNLLSAIGMFLLKPASKAEDLFKDAQGYGNFDELLNSELLLKMIMSGNMKLQEKFYNLGASYEQVISTFDSHGITTIFLPEVRKDQINFNKYLPFIEPRNLENNDLIIFNLDPRTSDNPPRIEKVVKNLPPSSIFCKLKGKEPDQISWGYGGDGVRNLAYTLLYELFNNKKQKHGFDEYIPNQSQIELIVYKLLSRLHSGFEYSITSEQILNALREPLSEKDRKHNPKSVIPLEYYFDD